VTAAARTDPAAASAASRLLLIRTEDDYGPVPLAEGFAELLGLLAGGAEPAEAITRALDACRDAMERQRIEDEENLARAAAEDERWKRSTEDWARFAAARFARIRAREHAALTTGCPFCGSAPGERCRSTGPIGNSMTYAHAARARHAGMLP
jgi:hypothetical protein